VLSVEQFIRRGRIYFIKNIFGILIEIRCLFFSVNSVNSRAATGKGAVHGLLIAALSNLKVTDHQWMDDHVSRNQSSLFVTLTEQRNQMKNFNYEINKS
jgi:hypothetical protein